MNVRLFHKSEIAKRQKEDWVDTTRRVFVEGDTAYIPVKEGLPFDEILEERTPYKGRGYQKMGDTILIHGDAPTKSELEEIQAFEHPSCILHSVGQNGVMRIPEIRVLFGTPHEVTFREAGLSYTLDPSKVMFSQGNRGEKLRIRSLVREGGKSPTCLPELATSHCPQVLPEERFTRLKSTRNHLPSCKKTSKQTIWDEMSTQNAETAAKNLEALTTEFSWDTSMLRNS